MIDRAAEDAKLVERLNKSAELAERYRAADAERRRQDALAERARTLDAWAKEAQRLKSIDDNRLERERAESAALIARRQAQAEAQQKSQWAWATRRKELEAAVTEIRGQLRSAQGRVLSAPLADAVNAAAEVAVFTPRLEAAERAVESHARSQPRAYA